MQVCHKFEQGENEACNRSFWKWIFSRCGGQGRNEGRKGGPIPRAPIHYGGVESLQGRSELLLEAPKSPNNVTSTFFNTVNLPSKELRFDHRGAKLRPWRRRFDQRGAEFVFCPGRHLTSLRPWWWLIQGKEEIDSLLSIAINRKKKPVLLL